MGQIKYSGEELRRVAESLYENGIRAAVETEANIGKLVSIDAETGAFFLSTESRKERGVHHLDAVRTYRENYPNASLYTMRVGYNAVYALGGTIERTFK